MFGIIIRVALRELRGAWTRSLLTMLGVVIGVASVIAMVGLGEGAKQNVVKNIRNLGANLLIVRPGLLRKRHVRRIAAQTLTIADAELIRRRVPHVVAVAPSLSRAAQIKFRSKNTNVSVVGVTPSYLSVRSFSVDRGRFFSRRDVAGSRRVVALGVSVVHDLFGERDPIGERIKINALTFKVVAVMEPKGDMGWFNADDQVMIPVTTFQRRLFGLSHVETISVQVDDKDNLVTATAGIKRLLRHAHRIRSGVDADFHVRSQLEIMKSMEEITRTFTLLLGGIAAISLLVGGIGIMNIMLVTVTERTREVGLKKALGARRRDILKQFLVESVLLSSVGGFLGVALGTAIAYGIDQVAEWETVITPGSVLLAFTVAAGVGIFFGWYPAQKAARLDPVEALRRE